MLPGPVFAAELLTSARRARYYVIRTLYGLVLLFFIWQNGVFLYSWNSGNASGEFSIQQLAILGQSLFVTLVTVQSFAVLLLTPALVAGVIAEEKQRKTLHYLLASRLSSTEIVVGKLAARMLHVGVFLAIGLPVTSLLSLFGGVDPVAVVLVFAGTLSTAFFLSALAILVSTQARRPREAITIVYLMEIAWFFGPTFLAAVLPSAGPFWLEVYNLIRPVIGWVGPTSPLFLTTGRFLSGSPTIEPVLWMVGLQLAYGTLFVGLAVARLRPRFRHEGDGSRPGWARGLPRRRRILPRPACGDDPMLWKELYVSRTSLPMKVVAVLVGTVVTGILGYTTFIYAAPAFIELASWGYGAPGVESARNELNVCLRISCTLLYCLLGVGVASSASSGLTGEREEDTWISLVATPLSGTEIVRAKILGAVWAMRWLVLLLALLWLIGLAAGSVHPIAFVLIVLQTALFVWFASALGTAFSLGAKSSHRALIGSIATLLVLNGGYMMCCVPMRVNSLLIAMGVTPYMEAMTLFSYEDARWIFSGRTSGLSGGAEEVIMSCVLGTICYAIAATVLTHSTISRFEVVAGRPRRGGGFVPSSGDVQDKKPRAPKDRPASDGPDDEVDLA